MKDKSTCQRLFQEIAEGKIACPPEDRVEAMIRVGHLIHGVHKDRKRAYRLYKEIYNLSQTLSQRTEALTQLSGIMMELARSDKGNLEECRIFYENALEEIPIDFVFSRSTIELMHLETWSHEKNHKKCIEEAEIYISKYPDYKRNLSMCKLFLGISKVNLGLNKEAKEIFEEIVQMDLEEKGNKWKDVDVQERAVVWLIHICEAQNDFDGAEIWRQYKEQAFK